MADPREVATRMALEGELAKVQREMEGTDLEDHLAVLIPRGFPTFDEFKKNPDKYRLRPDDLFRAIQDSSQINRADLAKQKVYWRDGKESMTLGKLMRVAAEAGYTLDQLEIVPLRTLNSTGTGKDEVLVRVYPKSEVRAMGGIVANDA